MIHDGTKLAVAVLKPATPAVGATFTDTRAWIGVKATDVGASLEGIDGLTIAVTGGSFQFNSASGLHDDNGATAGGTITNATALNWATALGTAPTVGTQTIDLNGQLLSLAGTATIDVFGFFTGQFAFTVLMRNVDVDLGGAVGAELINASLVTLSLTVVTNPVTIGQGGVGFTVGVGSGIAVAALTAPALPAGTGLPTDSRKWTAIKVELVAASLIIGGLQITDIDGTFQINSATGQHDSNGGLPTDGTITPAVALDWRIALDLDDDGVFSENDDPTSETTDDVLVVGTETIDLVGTGMRVSGSADLDVFGILTGSASFALSNRLVDVDLDGVAGGETLDNATLTLVAISEIDLSFGTPDAGLDIGPGGTIGIAILKAPVTATDTRTWMAVVAKNLAITPNLPGIGGQIVNGSLKINRVSGAKNGTNLTDADALNWATADGLPLTVDLNEAGGWTAPTALVDPGEALPTPTFLPVTLRGAQTAVAGTLQNLNIFDFVTGGANFAMQSQTVDVDLDGNGDTSGEQLNDATLLTIALDELNLSIGAGGAGLAVTSGRLGIAILTAPTTGYRQPQLAGAVGQQPRDHALDPGDHGHGHERLGPAQPRVRCQGHRREHHRAELGHHRGRQPERPHRLQLGRRLHGKPLGAGGSGRRAEPAGRDAGHGARREDGGLGHAEQPQRLRRPDRQRELRTGHPAGRRRPRRHRRRRDAQRRDAADVRPEQPQPVGRRRRRGPGDHRRQARHRDDQGSAADDRGRHRQPQLDGDHGQGPHDLARRCPPAHLGQRHQRHAEDQQGRGPVPGAHAAGRDGARAGARHGAELGDGRRDSGRRSPSTSTRPAAGPRRRQLRRPGPGAAARPTRCRSPSAASCWRSPAR